MTLPATPGRLLVALARANARRVAAAALLGVLAAVPVALLQVVIGRAVEAVLAAGGISPALLGWVALAVGLGLLGAAAAGAGEYLRTVLWIQAGVRTLRAVVAHAARLGATLPARTRAGEVVAIGASDVHSLGTAVELIGPVAGAAVAAAVASALLLQVSPLLGAVALVGVPLATAGLTPLLGPLRQRTEAHREQVGAATTLAGDIVAGLRVLRGVGGEQRFADRFAETSLRVRRAGVAAGRVDAWLAGVEVLAPGVVTVAVTWLGARQAVAGELTVGELVTCYGLSAYLVLPVATAAQAVHATGEALVAADRVVALLALRPDLGRPARPTPLPSGAFGLADPATGLRCPPGVLTVVRVDGDAGALADRLGRHVESPVQAVPAARDASAGDTAGGAVPLADADLDEVRARVLVAGQGDLLFTGPLADEVGLGDRVTLDAALWAADADDVLAGLPDGTAAVLVGRGRRLSGGQRQRLLLARALTRDADVLVLDRPTSAVDAHTEARVAGRVAELRRGRTTVVVGGGPLWTAVADHVVDGAPS